MHSRLDIGNSATASVKHTLNRISAISYYHYGTGRTFRTFHNFYFVVCLFVDVFCFAGGSKVIQHFLAFGLIFGLGNELPFQQIFEPNQLVLNRTAGGI